MSRFRKLPFAILGIIVASALSAGVFSYSGISITRISSTADSSKYEELVTTSFSEREAGFEDINGENGQEPRQEMSEPAVPPPIPTKIILPDRPLRVGLQVGHWKNNEVPNELSGLKRNGGGAVGGGTNEWRAMLVIAEAAAEMLRDKNITVDLLPATIPPAYRADAFISIHADGNAKQSISGYKIAGPRRDSSGMSKILENILYQEYGAATGLTRDRSITRRMTGYYAFNHRKYTHAISPWTPAVILETGFLTSPADQEILIHDPKRAAEGITQGVLRFLSRS